MPRTIAYLRISTEKQDLDNQRLSIMDYTHVKNIKIDEFLKIQASSKLSESKRMIDTLFEKLQTRDILIVSELSRLGRNLGQIIQIIDKLLKNEIKFLALKENIILDEKQNIQNKVMVAMFWSLC